MESIHVSTPAASAHFTPFRDVAVGVDGDVVVTGLFQWTASCGEMRSLTTLPKRPTAMFRPSERASREGGLGLGRRRRERERLGEVVLEVAVRALVVERLWTSTTSSGVVACVPVGDVVADVVEALACRCSGTISKESRLSDSGVAGTSTTTSMAAETSAVTST